VKWIYKKCAPREEIPFKALLNNKKLGKYFNRETALGVVCLAELLHDVALSPDTPAFYDTGLVEYEDFGLDSIVETCVIDGKHSQQSFVEKGMSSISPLTQFKILLNMPLCFFSIEHRLTGDNAVTYSSAEGLLTHARLAEAEHGILIGAGKVNPDGSVESGFALATKDELSNLDGTFVEKEGIDIFRTLNAGAARA
jgi:hypothetical protein